MLSNTIFSIWALYLLKYLILFELAWGLLFWFHSSILSVWNDKIHLLKSVCFCVVFIEGSERKISVRNVGYFKQVAICKFDKITELMLSAPCCKQSCRFNHVSKIRQWFSRVYGLSFTIFIPVWKITNSLVKWDKSVLVRIVLAVGAFYFEFESGRCGHLNYEVLKGNV